MIPSRVFFLVLSGLIAVVGLFAAAAAHDYLQAFGLGLFGFGTLFEPASGQIPPNNKSIDKTARDSFYAEFTPTKTGVYTFFCRIHKSMRGAFKVIE